MPGFYGKQQYALGWAILEDFFGETIIHHGGSTGVSSAYLAMIPEKELGVVILGNVGNSQGGLLSQVIFAALLGKNPQTELPVLRLEAKLNKFVGEYQTYKGLAKIAITKQGLILTGKSEENPSTFTPIVPKSDALDDFQFYIPTGDRKFPVYFEENVETGQIDFYYERTRFHKIGPVKVNKK